jgi:hypothetical protein
LTTLSPQRPRLVVVCGISYNFYTKVRRTSPTPGKNGLLRQNSRVEINPTDPTQGHRKQKGPRFKPLAYDKLKHLDTGYSRMIQRELQVSYNCSLLRPFRNPYTHHSHILVFCLACLDPRYGRMIQREGRMITKSVL